MNITNAEDLKVEENESLKLSPQCIYISFYNNFQLNNFIINCSFDKN